MKYFQKIADGIDVAPLLNQIEANPALWNANKARLSDDPSSVFYGTSDIWVRYREINELTRARAFGEPHFAVFYPAWYALPALRPIVFGIMARVEATHLGGILITRIPAGGEVKPHSDRGSWHAETMNCKVYVPLQANDKCVNYCGDEALVIKTGEAVIFDNLITHSVRNDGDTDRITLIICMRTEPC